MVLRGCVQVEGDEGQEDLKMLVVVSILQQNICADLM